MARFFEKLILVFDMLRSLKGVRIIRWKNIERFFSIKDQVNIFHCWLSFRHLVKSVYQKNNLLIFKPKHMLWVLKRTVPKKLFF